MGALALVGVIAAGTAAAQQPMNWQEAVATFAAERTRAETCVLLLKRHVSDDAALSAGARAYSEAKADVDSVIAGLVGALAQVDRAEAVDALADRLRRGVQVREAFCEEVLDLVPIDPGTRDVIVDVLREALGPLADALTAIYGYRQEEDELRRRTIQAQLESAKWRGFEEIAPAP